MTEPEPPEGNDNAGADTVAAEVEKWKTLARKHEQQAKANAEAAKRLADIEAAQKTAEEKAAEARAQAEERAAKAELALMKRDAAEEAGLPKGWADRLRGTTAEELLADAKALAKELPAPTTQTQPRPVADLRPGALPASNAPAMSASAQIDAAIRKAAGRGN